jgi:hypothetical protein
MSLHKSTNMFDWAGVMEGASNVIFMKKMWYSNNTTQNCEQKLTLPSIDEHHVSDVGV